MSRIDVRRRSRRAYRSSIPVISVGNISVGGAGKTPLTQYLIEHLQGDRPIIVLSRGYGRSDGADRIWRAGEQPPDPALYGDEPALLARSLLSGAIAVAPDRSRPLRVLETEFEQGTAILDDGFQHHQIARDCDIVIVDEASATPPFTLIPSGRLREHPASLGRADVVVATSERARRLSLEYLPPERVFTASSVPVGIRRAGVYDRGRSERVATSGGMLQTPATTRDVILVSGIAQPERVVAAVSKLGMKVIRHLKFRDHEPYSSAAIARIVEAATELPRALIVTTSKDEVKLIRNAGLVERLFVIEIVLRFDDEVGFLQAVRRRLPETVHQEQS